MKILIIGNIANNGYLLAKFLRGRNIEVDVLCYDYYDIMSCPEWEEAEITGDWGPNEHPQWYRVDVGGYRRPTWFVQGVLSSCVDFLRDGRKDFARRLKRHGQVTRPSLGDMISLFWRPSDWRHLFSYRLSALLVLPFVFLKCSKEALCREWFSRFCWNEKVCSVPDSSIHGRLNAFLHVDSRHTGLGELFGQYDIIQGHATDSLFPYVYGAHPFIALEHGTIRHIPFESNFWGKLTRFSYQAADKVLITNCDNIQAANRLGLNNYTFLPHPVNESGIISHRDTEDSEGGRQGAEDRGHPPSPIGYGAARWTEDGNVPFDTRSRASHSGSPLCSETEDDEQSMLRTRVEELRESLLKELAADYLVLHPSRQHWEPDVRHPDWEKGNDIFIRGLAEFIKDVNPKAGMVFVEWGQKVKETKKLLKELGIADRVKWIKPMHHLSMVRHIQACDILADQFYLGAFGSITPKALLCGRAVLLNLNEEMHQWAFPEMPPVINCKTPEDVFEGLKKHYEDADYRVKIEKQSVEWYWKYHSSKVITDKLISVYKEVLEKQKTKNLSTQR